jgi:hypothetical protein
MVPWLTYMVNICCGINARQCFIIRLIRQQSIKAPPMVTSQHHLPYLWPFTGQWRASPGSPRVHFAPPRGFPSAKKLMLVKPHTLPDLSSLSTAPLTAWHSVHLTHGQEMSSQCAHTLNDLHASQLNGIGRTSLIAVHLSLSRL